MGTKFPPGSIRARGFDWEEIQFAPRQISKFATLRYGKGLTESKRRSGLVPVYGTNGQCGSHDEALADSPGVVLGRKGQGHLGVEWVDKPFWVIDTAYFAEVNEHDADLRWFYYLTKYVGLDHLKSGEKPGLSRGAFLAQVVPFPPKEEQRRIGDLLGALDDKIKLNQQTGETLEALARGVFRAWFVDFEFATAKGADCAPVGMCSEFLTLFSEPFVESPLGLIPSGWRVSQLGTELTTRLGGTPSRANSAYWENGTIPWINSGEVNRFRILSGTELITRQALEESSTKLVPAHTTVLAITGATLGQVSILEIDACVNQSVVAVLPSKLLSTPFIYCWIRENIDALLGRRTGAAHQHINKNDVNELPVLLPDSTVLEAFANMAEPLFDQIKSLCVEETILASIRDFLVPKLLSGKIRVRQAERMLEEVGA